MPTPVPLSFTEAPAHAASTTTEDGGRDRICRQGPSVQPPFPADVRASGRADRLYAGLRLGEGAGREPGRQPSRAAIYPQLRVTSYDELNAWPP